MKVALWAIILSLNSMVGMTEDVKPSEATKGCLMRFCSFAGDCATQYFVKVADDEYDNDDGDPQIWGFDPMNKHYDRQGKLIFIPAKAEDFIKAGGAAFKSACTCHCPLW